MLFPFLDEKGVKEEVLKLNKKIITTENETETKKHARNILDQCASQPTLALSHLLKMLGDGVLRIYIVIIAGNKQN